MSLRWNLEWRLTLASALLLPLFVALGFWQLERAAEKRALAQAWEQRRQAPPVALAELAGRVPAALAYTPVQLRGEFIRGREFLLDNRVLQGRYGVEVLSPLRLEGGGLVMVNRGWLAADPARRTLPAVPGVPGQLVLRGHVYVPPGEPYLLSGDVIEGEWPRRIQALDFGLIRRALTEVGHDGAMFPYSVRLDPGQPGALAVDWQVVNVTPAKHQGYALQWFSMAAALAVIFLFRSSNLWQVLRGNKVKQHGSA